MSGTDDLLAAASGTPLQGDAGKDRAEVTARETRAIRFRIAGLTYDQIAKEMGYSDRSTARDLVMRGLRRVQVESSDELRRLENARLDTATAALVPLIAGRATNDNIRIRAIDSFIRVSARRARMNGLDAPLEVQVSDEWDTRIAELAAQLGINDPTMEPAGDDHLAP